MLVRKDTMRASTIMTNRVKNAHNIEILWNTQVDEILGEEGVEGMRVINSLTGEKSDIAITGFFVAIGHKPNTEIFKGQLDMNESGYLLTAPDSTKTNLEGVFAAGDAQDFTFRQAVTAAGTGCMAALEAERYLAAKESAMNEAMA